MNIICSKCGKSHSEKKKWTTHCRACRNAYMRMFYAKDKETIKDRAKRYRAKNKHKVMEYQRKYREEHRDELRMAEKKRRLASGERINARTREIRKGKKYNYREKENARQLTRYYVKTGKIKKLPCSNCGDDNSQAHHEDYSKPMDVIWFCPPCHKAHHHGIVSLVKIEMSS